jgi:hypothetical protein
LPVARDAFGHRAGTALSAADGRLLVTLKGHQLLNSDELVDLALQLRITLKQRFGFSGEGFAGMFAAVDF